MDGGYNPAALRGSDTGVWIGCSRAETGEALSGKESESDLLFFQTLSKGNILRSGSLWRVREG